MRNKGLLTDFFVAIFIMVGMFAMMVYTVYVVDVEQPTPHKAECHDRYQLTTKEVLSCE